MRAGAHSSKHKDAARFHHHLDEQPAPGRAVLHLSTRMTTGHRREVIAEIKRLLDKGLDIQVVSTSLLEAGVGLDFPWVYRAWAPAESPQQAAGRCHRDADCTAGPSSPSSPPTASSHTAKRTVPPRMPARPTSGAVCQTRMIWRSWSTANPLRYALRKAASGSRLGAEVEDLRRRLDCPRIDRSFRMIEEGVCTPVVVIRREADRAAIEVAGAPFQNPVRPCGPEVLRSLQPNTASLSTP
ncbi:hypothetical protein ACFY0R_20890 [Streptomyces sp. NPDC001633]|uniref:hypothetical protein n=1 Tax=Streptomyces sp. NPDC001633 TaxID=3364595 RepID=UPI00368D8C89